MQYFSDILKKINSGNEIKELFNKVDTWPQPIEEIVNCHPYYSKNKENRAFIVYQDKINYKLYYITIWDTHDISLRKTYADDSYRKNSWENSDEEIVNSRYLILLDEDNKIIKKEDISSKFEKKMLIFLSIILSIIIFIIIILKIKI